MKKRMRSVAPCYPTTARAPCLFSPAALLSLPFALMRLSSNLPNWHQVSALDSRSSNRAVVTSCGPRWLTDIVLAPCDTWQRDICLSNTFRSVLFVLSPTLPLSTHLLNGRTQSSAADSYASHIWSC